MEKRKLLLDAAVRVFAKKGYHACRVGDIAKEAGVAYGLLYHYFSSKRSGMPSTRSSGSSVAGRTRESSGASWTPGS